jgi:hypothetical protein
VVNAVVIETYPYLNHVLLDVIVDERQDEHFKLLAGEVVQRQKQLTENKISLARNGHNQQISNQCANLRTEILH